MIPGATYRTDLDALIAGARSTFNAPRLPFIIGQMLPEAMNTGTRNEINEVHSSTPYRVPATGFSLSAPAGNSNGDGLHFNAVGQRINAANMFEEFLRVTTGLAPTNAVEPAEFPAGTVLVSDTFNRADGTLNGTTADGGAITGATWSVGVPAEATIAGNAAVIASTSTRPATITAGASNVRVSAKWETSNGTANGMVIGRYTSTANYLWVRIDKAGNTVKLYKRINDGTNELASASHTWAAGDEVALVMDGSSVSVEVNGSVKITPQTVTELQTATGAGIGHYGTGTAPSTTFDDFTVTAV